MTFDSPPMYPGRSACEPELSARCTAESNVVDEATPISLKRYTKEQQDVARSVKLGKVLDHLGATHKQDPEYKPKRAGNVRVRVGYKGCDGRYDFRFVFSGRSWIDDLANGDLSGRSGNGAVDFVMYLTGKTFPKAVAICLEAAGQSPIPEGEEEPRQLEFPYWPNDTRSLPNEILRSALFNARNRNVKRLVWEAKAPACIAVLGDGVIKYVGEELRQIDETVWLQLIHLARNVPPGAPVEFVAKQFCEEVSWPLCKTSYEQLISCLKRMQATSLTVASKRLGKGVSVSMIPRFDYEDVLNKNQRFRRWTVTVAPDLVKLFGGMQYTWLEWQQRLKLPDGIATWLHGYFSTHQYPIPIPTDELARGAALGTENIENIKRTLRRGLNALREVGFLTSYRITKTHVIVERSKRSRDSTKDVSRTSVI